MPGKVIGRKLDFGFPGTFSRNGDSIIMNRVTKAVMPFGAAVLMNPNNTVAPFADGSSAADIIGIAVREVKQQTDFYNMATVYKAGEPADVITRGSVVVQLAEEAGKPDANAPVYIVTAENGAKYPTTPVGSFVTEEDSGYTEKIDNAVFTTGNVDANKVAEVTLLQRKA